MKRLPTLVFGGAENADRAPCVFTVRAGDRRFLLVCDDEPGRAIRAAMEHLGAATSRDLAKPFEVQRVGDDDPGDRGPWIPPGHIDEIVVVLK